MSEGAAGSSKIKSKIRWTVTSVGYRLAPRLTTNVLYESYKVEREMIFLPALCDKTRISLDVGAHLGIYSFHMTKLSSKVLSFEPDTYIFKRLARRMPRSVEVFNCALSDVNGTADLRMPGNRRSFGTIEPANGLGGLGPVSAQRIETRKLDDLTLPGAVGFMKIDVEGHELAVLRGGLNALRRDRPQLLIEIEERHRPRSLDEVRSFLGQMSYTGYFFDGSTLRPIDEFKISLHQHLGVPPYINNFIFATSDRREQLEDLTQRSM